MVCRQSLPGAGLPVLHVQPLPASRLPGPASRPPWQVAEVTPTAAASLLAKLLQEEVWQVLQVQMLPHDPFP